MERTFAIIKPDAVSRRLAGQILARIEAAGFIVRAMRLQHLSKKEAEGFYAVHKERPFFGELTDFNPDTLARYRVWLGEYYESIEALNDVWGTKHASFAQVLPPLPPLRQAEIADWQRFLESWIDAYLQWLAELARECGVPVPLLHNEQVTR